MVQLALAGATIPQIAALSGQSIAETSVPRRADIALAGVEAWELRERDVPSSLAEDLKQSPGSNEHSPNQNQQKNAAQQATNPKNADLTGV
ncbi:hypothetical protein HB662_03880 [Roseomonas frigidaquae]|uniref:Uncharacterized protein n=1 Tax=Falsiroseomonas frigidaquae TaxID=487318 RepID=A0ABX1ETN0_9PROT|nr:hypothetical protein [Falsiroseomonas frigidaquae]NKE43903.1 hypothetical protein [Falsiroseomonas frigidaquae]